MSNSEEKVTSPWSGPTALKSWEELIVFYGRCLKLSRDFIKAARDGQNVPEAEEWLNFLSQRAEQLDCAAISLKRVFDHQQLAPLSPEEEALRNQVAAQLDELKALEDELRGILGGTLDDIKDMLAHFARGQAAFKGYSQVGQHLLPHLLHRRG